MFEEGGRNEQVCVITRNKRSTNALTVAQRPRLMTLQPVPLEEVGSDHHPVIKFTQISLQKEATINPAVYRHSFTMVYCNFLYFL